MATEKSPFIYDAEQVKAFFAGMKFPFVDAETLIEVQKKNIEAAVAANKAVLAGYQEIVKRQAELAEKALVEARETLAQIKDKPLSPETVSANAEAVTKGFEQALSAATELTSIAHKANIEAFEIARKRFAEALDEFRAAGEKAAA